VADPRKGYARAFCRYVVGMARHMTKSAIAAKLEFVGWNTIKTIIKDDLKKDARAGESLIAALEDKDADVRNSAAKALARIKPAT